jgi:hypothetical protein
MHLGEVAQLKAVAVAGWVCGCTKSHCFVSVLNYNVCDCCWSIEPWKAIEQHLISFVLLKGHAELFGS